MLQTEKATIVEFLQSTDPEISNELNSMPLSDLIELLIEKVNDTELDYSILSTAYVNGVNPARFEEFHEAVMDAYENISDGEEIPVNTLDTLASRFK